MSKGGNIYHHAFCHGQPGCLENSAGSGFIHSSSRGPNARMGVGNTHPVQYTLNTAILTKTTMQGVKHHIRFLGV